LPNHLAASAQIAEALTKKKASGFEMKSLASSDRFATARKRGIILTESIRMQNVRERSRPP
jgi:hypothetical protein